MIRIEEFESAKNKNETSQSFSRKVLRMNSFVNEGYFLVFTRSLHLVFYVRYLSQDQKKNEGTGKSNSNSNTNETKENTRGR